MGTKMTRLDRMGFWFRMKGRKATLGEILSSGELWVHEFNARKAEARAKGYVFILHRGTTPSENVYTMAAEPGQQQTEIAI